MTQILKNTQVILDVTFSVGYADGAVTFVLKDLDGATVVSGAATKDLVNVGRYTFTLSPRTTEASLVATWSGVFGGVTESLEFDTEIVGGVLFTIQELRDFADGRLGDETKYPDEMLIEKRAEITDNFAEYCQVSFITRHRRVILDGTNRESIWLPSRQVQSVLAVSIGGVSISTDLVYVYDWGQLKRLGGWSSGLPQGVQVDYVHGYNPVPSVISRAAKILARYEMLNTELSDRMIMFTSELGTVRLSTPDNERKRPTGIPLVDATLNRFAQGDIQDEMMF